MPRSERDIVIGKIVAPLGTRGEVKALVLTDFPERFKSGVELRLSLPDGSVKEVKIESARVHREGLALKIKDVESRNDAEALRNAEFTIDQSELGELPSDKFYLFDLIGLKVVSDDGREWGEVTEVMQGGANDVYITSAGICIPALKTVVAKVDVGERLMVIHPVPGLLPED
jgi:16S rRNA processing protein RimM